MFNRRRELRNNQTPAEKFLWRHISKNKICDLRFLRQYSVGPYVLDFYCPKIRLAIEIDGSHHVEVEVKIYDKDRQEFLKNLDIEVIRFWNDEVLKNIKNTLTKIKVVSERLKSRE